MKCPECAENMVNVNGLFVCPECDPGAFETQEALNKCMPVDEHYQGKTRNNLRMGE